MTKLLRDPQIIWRLEKRREQEVFSALERGEDVSALGTVTLIRSGMMHQLNLLGGMIWQLCDGTRGVPEVVAALAPEFEVPREELEADVEEFVDDLVQRGWLRHE